MKLKSIRTDDLLSNALRTSITCNSCFCSTVREEKLYIVSVPMADNVSSSQRNFFHLSCCLSHIFCKKKKHQRYFSYSICTCLKHFCVELDKVIKDVKFFKCLPGDPLQIQITDSNQVSFLTTILW